MFYAINKTHLDFSIHQCLQATRNVELPAGFCRLEADKSIPLM